ncbi:MAG: baseplate J/gp47 family protein [Rhodospirillales bacterium]|nr:baseplate J/gp47 family protein [Rhodospirillales bacterium]
MSNSITSLPPPVFLNDADGLDPNLILADMIAAFQNASGRTLYPAQVERLLINLYAYREALVRNAIQYTGQQNLLAYATYPMIDYLGQLLGVTRLASVAATCTIQFTMTGALTVPLTIDAGTQVGTSDGNFLFATNAALVIQTGATSGSVAATCTTTGSAANGYLAGQVDVLIGANALIASVANTTATAGGSDTESDDHLRTRIQAAPNQFSTAGPSGSYNYWTLTADATIAAADIYSPAPGQVAVYVLTGPITVQPAASPNSAGIPSAGVIAEVVAVLNGATVRPLTDTVSVAAVTEVDYTVTATVTMYANAPSTAEAAAYTAAQQLALNLANGVRTDLVPSQWVAALSVAGVYEVTLTLAASIGGTPLTPLGDGRFVLQPGQWANCTAITLTYQTSLEEEPL